MAPRPRGVGVRGVGGGVGCPPRGDAAARCHFNHNPLIKEHKGPLHPSRRFFLGLAVSVLWRLGPQHRSCGVWGPSPGLVAVGAPAPNAGGCGRSSVLWRLGPQRRSCGGWGPDPKCAWICRGVRGGIRNFCELSRWGAARRGRGAFAHCQPPRLEKSGCDGKLHRARPLTPQSGIACKSHGFRRALSRIAGAPPPALRYVATVSYRRGPAPGSPATHVTRVAGAPPPAPNLNFVDVLLSVSEAMHAPRRWAARGRVDSDRDFSRMPPPEPRQRMNTLVFPRVFLEA